MALAPVSLVDSSPPELFGPLKTVQIKTLDFGGFNFSYLYSDSLNKIATPVEKRIF